MKEVSSEVYGGKQVKKSRFSCFLSLENQSNLLTSAQSSLICLPMGSQGKLYVSFHVKEYMSDGHLVLVLTPSSVHASVELEIKQVGCHSHHLAILRDNFHCYRRRRRDSTLSATVQKMVPTTKNHVVLISDASKSRNLEL